jgi:putative ABC transport system ATP-binding protein
VIPAVLTIENVTKSYRGPERSVQALDGVSLRLAAGEFVAVQGPSGCGKTTLLLAAGGLLKPDGGRVIVDEQDLYNLSSEQRARFRAEHIGFVFQQFHLVPYLTVRDNVLTPALAATVPDAAKRADELIEQVGLTPRRLHVPAALSTGERQRVALARALLARPKLLLADEPTGNLDLENGRLVLEQLTAFARGGGAVLLVTHEAVAAQVAQRTLFMREGKLLDTGAAGIG